MLLKMPKDKFFIFIFLFKLKQGKHTMETTQERKYERIENRIILLDGSRKFHVNNALATLADIQDIRGDLNVDMHVNMEYVDNLVRHAFDARRGQVDVTELAARLSLVDYFHNQNRDATKVILLDQDLFDSRVPNMNFGFGVNLPFYDGNKYILVSAARMQNELHYRHVIRHELGHAFGAPNPSRPGVYQSLGHHCPDSNCTMHQELNGRSSYEQAVSIVRNGNFFCPSCKEDIRRS